MDLRIKQNFAQIGLKISQPYTRIKIRDPILKLKQTLPKAELNLEGARVDLDSTRCWEEIGLKKLLSFTRDKAQKGYETCFSYTEQVASEGDMMAQPEKYDLGAIMSLYGSKAFQQFDYNFTRLPQSLVDVEVIPAKTELVWRMGRVQGEYRPGDVLVNPLRGRVNVYLRQKADLKIEYVPQVDVYG